jgi:hypothetical protein
MAQVVNCGLEKESSLCVYVGRWYVMCAGEKQLQIMKGFPPSLGCSTGMHSNAFHERYQIMVPLRRRLRGVSVT